MEHWVFCRDTCGCSCIEGVRHEDVKDKTRQMISGVELGGLTKGQDVYPVDPVGDSDWDDTQS